MHRLIAPLLIATATSATAGDAPLSAAEFEAYSTGKTLYYGSFGAPYGAEQYMPGRRVIWTFLDGQCQEGEWYEEAGQICFLYDTKPGLPQCWSFYLRDGGLAARFEGDEQIRPLIEVEQSDKPLDCPGPAIGV